MFGSSFFERMKYTDEGFELLFSSYKYSDVLYLKSIFFHAFSQFIHQDPNSFRGIGLC